MGPLHTHTRKSKSNVIPVYVMKRYGGVELQLHPFITYGHQLHAGGSQKRSARFAEEKNSLHLPTIETQVRVAHTAQCVVPCVTQCEIPTQR